MTLFNQWWTEHDGSAIGNVPSPKLVVHTDTPGLTLSEGQQGFVRNAYAKFCTSVATSCFPKGYHRQEYSAADGTKVVAESINGTHKAQVWISGGQEPFTGPGLYILLWVSPTPLLGQPFPVGVKSVILQVSPDLTASKIVFTGPPREADVIPGDIVRRTPAATPSGVVNGAVVYVRPTLENVQPLHTIIEDTEYTFSSPFVRYASGDPYRSGTFTINVLSNSFRHQHRLWGEQVVLGSDVLTEVATTYSLENPSHTMWFHTRKISSGGSDHFAVEGFSSGDGTQTYAAVSAATTPYGLCFVRRAKVTRQLPGRTIFHDSYEPGEGFVPATGLDVQVFENNRDRPQIIWARERTGLHPWEPRFGVHYVGPGPHGFPVPEINYEYWKVGRDNRLVRSSYQEISDAAVGWWVPRSETVGGVRIGHTMFEHFQFPVNHSYPSVVLGRLSTDRKHICWPNSVSHNASAPGSFGRRYARHSAAAKFDLLAPSRSSVWNWLDSHVTDIVGTPDGFFGLGFDSFSSQSHSRGGPIVFFSGYNNAAPKHIRRLSDLLPAELKPLWRDHKIVVGFWETWDAASSAGTAPNLRFMQYAEPS